VSIYCIASIEYLIRRRPQFLTFRHVDPEVTHQVLNPSSEKGVGASVMTIIRS